MNHLDHLSDEHPVGVDIHVDPYEEMAEAEAAAMVANGLIKATKGPNPRHLTLLKGTAEPDNPHIIDLR